jgi:hypothetical protein
VVHGCGNHLFSPLHNLPPCSHRDRCAPAAGGFRSRGKRKPSRERRGTPRQAPAVATQRGETAGAAVQFSPLADRDGSGPRQCSIPPPVGSSTAGSAACPTDPHCTWPSDQKKRPPWGPAWRLSSEGDQRLHLWTESHSWRGRLLLKQQLGCQLSQAGIALAAQRQIIQHLPGELLQAGFAGQRSHGRAPHRTLQPAGGGSRARPQLRCGAERSQPQHRRACFNP